MQMPRRFTFSVLQVLCDGQMALFRARSSVGQDSDSGRATGLARWLALLCIAYRRSTLHITQHHLLPEPRPARMVLLHASAGVAKLVRLDLATHLSLDTQSFNSYLQPLLFARR